MTQKLTDNPQGKRSEIRDDLDFAPVENPDPRILSIEQIECYNEHGYIRPLPIFNDLEVARNRAYFDYVLAQLKVLNDGRDHYAINGYQLRCRGIYDLATDTRILDRVEDLIGPNIVCWATHFFAKMPHDPKAVPWHQDASYWQLSPARTVTAWLAIDDADRENSAMMFMPGTHRMGHMSWKEADRDAVLNQQIEGIDKLGQPIYDELKSGQISLHADMLVHGSEPNQSPRRRCGLTLRYCPPHVTPLQAAWGQNSIICRGHDPTGNWSHSPPPPGEDLTSAKPKAIGGN